MEITMQTINTANPSHGDTKILLLFRERCRLRDAIENSSENDPNASDETLDAEVAVMRTVEAKIMSLPSTCAADFAAKAIVDTAEAGCLSEWETGALWKEARRLTGWSI
jgi:hypothetical protein